MPLAHQETDELSKARLIASFRDEIMARNPLDAILLNATNGGMLGVISAAVIGTGAVGLALGAALPLVAPVALAAIPAGFIAAKLRARDFETRMDAEIDRAIADGEIDGWDAAQKAGIIHEDAPQTAFRNVLTLAGDFPGHARTTANPAQRAPAQDAALSHGAPRNRDF
jgi:hypothetical protein